MALLGPHGAYLPPIAAWLIRFWRVGCPKKVRARYEHPPPDLWCTGRLMCAPEMIASVISAAFFGAPGPRAASSLAVKPPGLAQEAD
jgi:hypothetical protein